MSLSQQDGETILTSGNAKDRVIFYAVPVPGENKWVKDISFYVDNSLIHSLTRFITHPPTHLFIHAFAFSFASWIIISLIHSLFHSLFNVLSLIHFIQLTHLPAQTFYHSLSLGITLYLCLLLNNLL